MTLKPKISGDQMIKCGVYPDDHNLYKSCLVTPTLTAFNLLGVITCKRALDDARKSFYLWRGNAHSCMLYSWVKDEEPHEQQNPDHQQPNHH